MRIELEARGNGDSGVRACLEDLSAEGKRMRNGVHLQMQRIESERGGPATDPAGCGADARAIGVFSPVRDAQHTQLASKGEMERRARWKEECGTARVCEA